MTTQTEIAQRNHRRAVRFFWGLLIGATTVSLIGNMVHAVLPYIPKAVIQIGASKAAGSADEWGLTLLDVAQAAKRAAAELHTQRQRAGESG